MRVLMFGWEFPPFQAGGLDAQGRARFSVGVPPAPALAVIVYVLLMTKLAATVWLVVTPENE